MAEQHEKALVPQIRFTGFTDPWEQRKLGELFEESDERASDREILSVSVANGIYPASESDRETNPGASLANYKVVHSGDVVYNSMRMWQGAVDASRYDGIVSPAYVVAKPNSEVYARFFARLLRQPMLLKQYQQVSQGNSKDTQVLKFYDFASIEISMPASENEQRRIGAFFDRLDSLITLHQRKYDKLCVLKKSMLDKMFPKGGSLYPEIRFAGFTDPWEQRKLGEIVSIGAGAPPSAFSAGNFLYVKVDDLNESSHFQFDSAQRVDANTAVKPIRKGSIIFAKRGAAILGNKVRVLGKTAYIDTNMMALEPRGVDADFLWLFINQTGLYRIADTSTIPQINNKHIEPYPVDIPNMAEQQAIGTFFSRLDDLITLHQRKLELLQDIKKSLLDKMFV